MFFKKKINDSIKTYRIMSNSLTARDLLKNEGIITASPNQTLAQALAKIQSSHDAVFITNENNQLLGVISPYYALFQSNFPPAAKIENCLYSPPKLYENSPISDIARNMLESKVYFLPVFSQNNVWIGIVSIRTLLTNIIQNTNYLGSIRISPKTRIITIAEGANLGEARKLLRSKGVSKLPVVNKSGKLVGILTRYDLREALTQPKSSQSFLSRSGEKRKFINKPIRGFYKRSVITATNKTNISQMVQQMLSNNIGSIIIINSKWQPINILSFTDLLKAITEKPKQKKVQILISFQDDFQEKIQFEMLINNLVKKLQNRTLITKLEVNLKIDKNRAEKNRFFNVGLTVAVKGKKIIVAEGSDFKWKKALHIAIKRLKKQLTRK